MNARWPLGPVCKPCYRASRTRLATCTGCNKPRVLIARQNSVRVCGPCAGHSDPYACPRCTNPRSYKVRGLCDRCTLHDHLAEVFDGQRAGPEDQYTKMREALAACDQPTTALSWLRTSRSAKLLADVVTDGRALTHEDLDALASAGSRGGARAVDYLRGILRAYQALPERDELPARVERHLARVLTRHPEHALLLRTYVRWSLLPRARRRSHRAYAFANRLRWAQMRINVAAHFLGAMQAAGLDLAEVTQHEVDQWLAAGRSTRYEVRDFLVWAARRGHGRDLVVPLRPRPDPVTLDEDSHWEILHQCLTDTALPLDVRCSGAILFLFGQEVTRIAALPADAVTARDQETVLVLHHVPIHLPAPLPRLLSEFADQPRPPGWSTNYPNRWLFPAAEPGRHITGSALARRLTDHGIPSRPARATALAQLAQDMPPPVLSALLGLHLSTVTRWRSRAVTDWTAYLEARAFSRAAPGSEPSARVVLGHEPSARNS
ncbi:helix-turn-helix domain-containing protein [Streptomyces sp. NPDC050548]|uniref:helix-turn-helix domain-containing protein n=1 Tax=Streptomyces sp. NPDC050548 TaxID=3365629 RepID=UPI0037966698